MDRPNVVLRGAPEFEGLWKEFLSKNSHASVFYSLHWMAYQKYYSQDRFVKDLSFVITGPGQKPLAICPLYIEEYNGLRRFSYRGEFLETLRTPLICLDEHRKHRKKLEEKVYDLIDSLAIENGVKKANFIIDPLCSIYEEERFNYLTQYGYTDISISTQIMDLKKSEEDLWMELRQSSRSLIDRAKKTYKIVLFDYKNPVREVHDQYVQMHHKVAGRITRPAETFDEQFEMLKDDEAILIGVDHEGKFVGFIYLIHGKKSAYAASAAHDPDFVTKVPRDNIVYWNAMLYYKSRGLEYMELDNQQFGPQLFDYPSKKDIAISFFKRGFGGKTYPLFRGVKYYDEDLMEKELSEAAGKLISETRAFKADVPDKTEE